MTRILALIGMQLVKEFVTAWFLYSRGVFHLAPGTEIAVSVAAGVVLAAAILGAVRLTTAGHTDPDFTWIFWVRVATWGFLTILTAAFVIIEPRSGVPMIALLVLAAWTAIQTNRRNRAAAAAEIEHAREAVRRQQLLRQPKAGAVRA
jgi:hypothetical protein